MTQKNNVSMVLSSCDRYEDAWSPFCRQLVTNWPEFSMPVYLGTESKTFKYPGMDIRCPLASGKIYRRWSERLLRLLDKVDTEFVLFMLDDFWLTAPVDNVEFLKILGYMQKNPRMGFVCLKQEIKDSSSRKDKDNAVICEYAELWECKKGKSFRITTQAGLWRKKYLIKILRAHESAWYFETRATWRSQFYRKRIFDVKQSVLVYPVGGFFGGGKCYRDYVSLYPKDVIEACVKKRGLINFGDKRDYPDVNRGFGYYWGVFKSMLPK